MERRRAPVSHFSDDDDPDDPGATTLERNRGRLRVTPAEFVDEHCDGIWALWRSVVDWTEVTGYPFFPRTTFDAFADAVARLSV